MEFRILGPLEVSDAGHPLALPGRKARALLAILLLHANEVVSAERLIDALWGEAPPETAANTLQVYVSQLRKSLPSGKEILRTTGRGYLLQVAPGQLDLARFEELVRDSRGADDPAEASLLLRDALSLWRGRALTDLASELGTQPEVARLDEERLVALEDRIEADLAIGAHDAVIGELEAIVAEHPLRERPRRLLMLALYRAGRQAEALALYQRTRRELVEELGIDPSPALQRLEKAILMQDPALDGPARPTPRAPAGGEMPRVPSGPARESRRTVTVLYSDVSPASVRDEPLDAEARSMIVSRALERVSEAVAQHGGVTETVVAGDALLGVFGIPRMHEDDALRAVRAAAEARGAIARLAEDLERERGLTISARTGASTGEVVTTGTLPVSGEPVSAAARLARTAPADGIVLDAPTERLVLNAVRVKPVAKKVAGGQAPAWLLAEVLEGAPAFARRLDAALVGRQVELAQLRQAFDQAVRDQTAYLFTVLGAAGIGKSRLALELRSLLADEAIVVTGRCVPYGSGITFRPLADVVAQLAGSVGKTRIAELLGGDDEANRVAERIAGALGFAEPAVDTEEAFWGVRKLLERIARRRPVVVVFDDIHWAEATFLDLVEHVADLSRSSPILLLCLARPELLDERPSWGGGKLNASSVLLAPLSERESSELMEQLRGSSPLDEEVRARVFEAAEGNPLFIEQFLAMLAEQGRSAEHLAVPPTIQALLAARLDRLEASERAVLEQASIVGKEFWQEAVANLLPEEQGLTTRLHALVRKDLIRPAGDRLRFRHQLIREAAYDALPKRARAESHERFAVWLEQAAAEQASESEETVGYHLEQAYRYYRELDLVDQRTSQLAARAAERLVAPGRRALKAGDLPAAVNLISRAVALMPDPSFARAEALSDLGETLRDAGDLQRADRTLVEAIETAATLGDRALEWRTRMVRLKVQGHLDTELTAHELESAAEQGREVLHELGDDRGLATAWFMLAWSRWLVCRAADAEEALTPAMEHARRAGAHRVEADSLTLLLGAGVFGPLAVDEAMRRCEQMLEQPVKAQRVEAHACRALAVLNAMHGDFEVARALVMKGRAILDELGLRFQAAATTQEYGTIELLAGEPDDAERALRLGYETLEEIGEATVLPTVAAYLGQALYAGGRYTDALRFSEISQQSAAEDDVAAQIQWRGPRAKVLARRGRTKKAEELASDAVALAERTDFLNQHADALLDLAEVRRLDGRTAEAREAAVEAVRLYERKGNLVSEARAKVFLKALGPREPRAAARRRARAG
jgi:DNA-binding SARP family transcriptional activator/class 3 adenylate cyclase